MAVYELDIAFASDENDFTQTVELDGRRYLLRFTWNTRDQAWRVSIYQPDRTPLALSRKIVVGVPLLHGEIDSRLPPGLLIAGDLNGKGIDPAHDELGERVVLFYFDASEFST